MQNASRRHRGWSLAVVAAAATLLAACGSSSSSTSSSAEAPSEAPSSSAAAESPTPSESASAEPLTIGYIQTGPYDYYVRGVDGANAAAPMLGASISVFNSDGKPEKEIANVEDAISQGVDGLIVFSVGRASLEADLAKAKAAGIPVAVLYGHDAAIEEDGLVFIQAPVTVTGQQAGDWVAANVAEGDVAIIQGALGRGDAEAYTDSFTAALAANPKLTVVATPEASWDRAKAQAAMADLLTAHPNLAAVFVQNEDMALGAVAAIKAAGKEDQVTVVSQNGSPDGIAAIESGEIAATVAWSPAQEAQMALVRLVDYLRDGTVPDPKLCNTPTVVVTADNLTDAQPWVPTEESTAFALQAPCGS